MHPWRASRLCGLQLSSWPRSMIFLCFLSHPLLAFATVSSAYLSFYIPEDSNLKQFSLLLLFLYVMWSNPIPFSSFLLFLSFLIVVKDSFRMSSVWTSDVKYFWKEGLLLEVLHRVRHTGRQYRVHLKFIFAHKLSPKSMKEDMSNF